MVHFFGVLNPAFGARVDSPDAPLKADFFGGAADAEQPTAAEFDADLLSGKAPESVAHLGYGGKERRFVRVSIPPYF
ncbi:hypothetical protein WH87_06595 [Devosia epidermidihirudinis]|uniref:Uncharacterized protein n=1 Tax=Devosia epidermidihirudinis TaxID=1293439 RepID=A0A0F5QFR2_9HYPH|nr:hypothetical protein [Devosia epidermidihirudinis]KKC39790.1 hypothetical protein WH87_06595 [Devosia epidermidihirudinis]